ncbi:hypothetical protein DBR06_SOUSAS510227 [Sousa chinensis]|nr:hypothetical protein DBR06_SOUSAS510227 [Sousa chinensis]
MSLEAASFCLQPSEAGAAVQAYSGGRQLNTEPPHGPEEPWYLVIQFLNVILLINNQSSSFQLSISATGDLHLSSPRILPAA